MAALGVEPFHAIARATGASVPQIGLALLAAALRAWNPDLRRHLRVALPISLQGRRRRSALGNHTSLLPVTLPCGEPGAAARLRHLTAEVGLGRMTRALVGGRDLAALPAGLAVPGLRLVSPLLRKARPRHLGVTAMRVTEWPGDDAFVVPVLAPGNAAMVVILHARAAVSFSAVFDAGVAGFAELFDHLGPALAELHAATTRA
ncbi:hypothetical protein MF672_050415 [Actinomadura sp. ATCC 31491]|uniref:DUF1298 domain-containing protein n=1 Tax=Actinomadura luzonensis TaxID=2805427 RepID=A0ABT0GC30_9ACTN|nr:hypothetical protein [Actinomadura luzonensis]MCK2221973.1 hypothetical protein [Actinomadura luzonensis]